MNTQNPVGASLLAIAVGQLAPMPNVPPPSRASSLPQGIDVSSEKQKGAFRRLLLFLRVTIRPFQPWFRSRRSARHP
ncbi:hypothetical protein FHJ31_21845 [Pseudomonas sp. Fig-3]|nr:hypothetical protein FHJ31_21845 [Pseudomonas sp. Fig-3]